MRTSFLAHGETWSWLLFVDNFFENIRLIRVYLRSILVLLC